MTTFEIRSPRKASINNRSESKPINLLPPDSFAVQAKGIEMVYKSGLQSYIALKGIDLKVPKGSIELLMGPSGSGKTTLLSILAGILTPSLGSVHLLGKEITDMSSKRLSRFRCQNIGFVFQGFNLFPALSALENVEVALNVKGISGKIAKEQSLELLTQVGLGDKAKNLPRDLSGGQKQRVAIARALAANPQVVMADEPTAALDSHTGQAIIELLCKLAKESGTTVVIVTHDPRIKAFADNVTYLEDGVITQEQH